MTMPTGSIYLYGKDGKGGNICLIDIETKEEFIEELKFIFSSQGGYDIDKYIKAEYKDSNLFTIYSVDVSRETLGM